MEKYAFRLALPVLILTFALSINVLGSEFLIQNNEIERAKKQVKGDFLPRELGQSFNAPKGYPKKDDHSNPLITDYVYIDPDDSPWWTGTVARTVAGDYVDNDGDIVCGDFAYGLWRYRGYAVFNISNIPDNASIESIVLNNFTFSEGSDDHCLAITGNFECDPRVVGGQILWNCLVSGTTFHNNTCLDWGRYEGAHWDDLNNFAINNLQQTLQTGQDWWALGFIEPGDDAGAAWFSGHEYEWPWARVNYDIPNAIPPGDEHNQDTNIPRAFELSQSYPNPFNAQTTIEYALPEAAHVTIEIYNLLGRKAETLVNQHQQAGYHQITWDASEVCSGVYFYKVQAGDFIEAKKMLLLK